MTDTLKSICEQCVHLLSPRLDFIPAESQRQRDIILRDLRELISAASNNNERTVVLLAGCLFESVLYCFIQSQSDYIAARRGSFTFDPDQSLSNYVAFFNRWFLNVFSIPDLVVDARDLVHINQELQNALDVCSRAAPEMIRLLDAFLGELAKYAQA